MNIKKSIGEITFETLNKLFMLLLMIITLYPFLHVTFASLSNPASIVQHTGLILHPIGFTLSSYGAVFDNPMIVIGYRNTIVYGTAGDNHQSHSYLSGSLCPFQERLLLA